MNAFNLPGRTALVTAAPSSCPPTSPTRTPAPGWCACSYLTGQAVVVDGGQTAG